MLGWVVHESFDQLPLLASERVVEIETLAFVVIRNDNNAADNINGRFSSDKYTHRAASERVQDRNSGIEPLIGDEYVPCVIGDAFTYQRFRKHTRV